MSRLYISIFIFLPIILKGQIEYVTNYSLENWENGMPVDWKIEENTVDIFKAGQKMIPFGVKTDDEKFRAVFPECGSEGLSYFGIAGNEIISGPLSQPLDEESFYEISFYVYNPPLYTDRATDKFTIQFEFEKGHSPALLLQASKSIDTTSHRWHKVSKVIKGSNREKRIRIGFLGDYYKDHNFNTNGLYYLFDEISIKKLIPKSDTINVFFDSGSIELIEKEISKLQTIKQDDYFNSIIKIEGYASALGKAKSNFDLANERANIVKSYLTDRLNLVIDTVTALGEIQSIAGDKKMDRKVSVIIEYLGSDKKPKSKILKSNYDTELLKTMERLILSDQHIRLRYDSVHNATDGDTILLHPLIQEMQFVDSLNINSLIDIFDNHGYPGLSKVGPALMDAAFLMLHHADLETRLKFDFLIKNAISNGEATKTWLPYYEDRNLLDQGKKQIYGTQLYWDDQLKKYVFFEIENRQNADRLRGPLRLGTINDYLKWVNNN